MLALQVDQFPEGGTQQRDTRDRLAALLEELPEPYRLILGLVELEGATLADVASLLQLSRASLRLIYIEGRRKLREIVLAHTDAGTL